MTRFAILFALGAALVTACPFPKPAAQGSLDSLGLPVNQGGPLPVEQGSLDSLGLPVNQGGPLPVEQGSLVPAAQGAPPREARFNVLWCGDHYVVNNPFLWRANQEPFRVEEIRQNPTGNMDDDMWAFTIPGQQNAGVDYDTRFVASEGGWKNGGHGYRVMYDGSYPISPTHECHWLDVLAEGGGCRVLLTCNDIEWL